MRSTGVNTIAVLTFVSLFVVLIIAAPVARPASAETLGSWTSTTPWNNSVSSGITGESCATYSGYIYCVGGFLAPNSPQSGVFFASISSSGVGTWAATTSYPTGFDQGSCVISAGYIYCVGGETSSADHYTNAVYFASVSSSGVGTWTSTTVYPITIEQESCAISGGYIYCVGGQNYEGFIQSGVNYASISSSVSTSSSSSSSTTSSTSSTTSSTSSTTAGGSAPCGPVSPPPSGTSAQDSCTGTPVAGSLTAVSTDTGITVSITGTSATGSVTITPSDETGAPSSGADLNLGTGASYYDVKVSGAVDGTAQVCISPPGATMQYYDSVSSSWVSASNIVVTGSQICGDIPVSALTGTPIATGTPVAPITGVPEFPVTSGLAVAALGILAMAVLLKMRSSKQIHT